jgi:transposase
LDVHRDTVHVAVRKGRGKTLAVDKQVFGTDMASLIRLRKYLREHGVKRVVMESTGVYWQPVWNVLEKSKCLSLVLVNPQHVKAIPGRKTDQMDCERLAELAQYNLLRGSFVPGPEIRELRELTRLRVKLVEEKNRLQNRLGRLLQTANYKLSSVITDLWGETGQLILGSMALGEFDPEVLAGKAQGSLRQKKAALVLALHGNPSEPFRWALGFLLESMRSVEERSRAVELRLSERMAGYADAVERLTTIPGVSVRTAWMLIAELGTEMGQFPSAKHAASWAGLCPGQNESAGKRQSGTTRKGDRHLRRGLVQCAWTVKNKHNCFLTTLLHRVAYRRGFKKAVMAVAHRILIIAYHILRDGTVYQEVGGDYHDRLRAGATAKRLTKRLQKLGYEVRLEKRDLREEVDEVLERRGRPCHCAQRGVECTHARKPKKNPSRPPKPKKSELLQAKIQAAKNTEATTTEQCPKCARWGIPCIHVRPKVLPKNQPSPLDTAT